MNVDTEVEVLTETGSEFQTGGDATLKDREPKLVDTKGFYNLFRSPDHETVRLEVECKDNVRKINRLMSC